MHLIFTELNYRDNMFTNKIVGWSLCLLVLGVTLCGCKKSKVVMQGTAELSLTVDWSGIKSGSVAPESATVYLYPIIRSGETCAYGEPIIYHVVPVTKTQLVIPEGSYRIIAHNDNLDKIKLRNQSICENFEGYVEPIAKVAAFSRSEVDVVPEVECLHLLTGTSSKEVVIVKDVPLDLTIRPRTATNTYRFTIRVNSPWEYESATAMLSGVATRINIFTATVQPVDISNINVPLTLEKNEQGEKRAIGHVEVLGVDPSNRNPGSNNLHLTLNPKQTDPLNPKPADEFNLDLTKDLDEYNNSSLDVELEVKPNPSGSGLVLLLISIKPWVVLPSIDIDVNPAE